MATALLKIFNSEEVNKLRKFILNHNDKNCDIYLRANDQLNFNLLSDRYFQLLKDIIGKDLTYFYDSSTFLDNVQSNTGIFHSDARNDNRDPLSSDYKVWRVGIYLQDHKNYSGGLKVIPKSHKRLLTNSLNKIYLIFRKFFKNNYKIKSLIPIFNYINIPSEPGDILIWNGRTHHCGRFKRLRWLKNFSFHPFIDRHIPSFLTIREKEERLILFQNWGIEDDSLINFIKYRINQKMILIIGRILEKI